MSDAEKFARMIHKAVQSADAATSVREILDTVTEFAVGDRVKKITGRYKFVGVVVAAFHNLSNDRRYVVENSDGLLHIFRPQNLARADDD